MHRRQRSGARNKLDLNDRVPVRVLKVSNRQLASLVRTAGDSIATIGKEAAARRRLALPAGGLIKEPEVTPDALS